MQQRNERPIKRANPSGKEVWVARYTGRDGKRRSAGTFDLKREAQQAINAAYEREFMAPRSPDTVGGYFERWPKLHPRAERTNLTNKGRIRAVLDVPVEGVPLRDWRFDDLRRRHTMEIVDVLLRKQKRAYTGAQNVLRSLAAMTEDAITDEVANANPFHGVRVRANDPRVQKRRQPVRVFSYEDMHRFARACGEHEAMVRVLSDCGLRLGELMPLRRSDLDLAAGVLRVRRTAWEGRVLDGTKVDHGEVDAGRIVPVPPGLAALLRERPTSLDRERLLFPSPAGAMWREGNWRARVWKPAQEATGLDVRPHEMRHSFVSHMRAAGVDDADLAAIAGHTVATMVGRYTHALGRSFDAVRSAVG